MQKFKGKNIFFSYWKTVLVILIILYLSFAPAKNFETFPKFSQFPHIDKITHLLMYFSLSIVLIKDFYGSRKKNIIFISVAFIFPVLLGGLIEILQEYCTSTRSGSWGDLIADIGGVILGWCIFLIFMRLKSHSK